MKTSIDLKDYLLRKISLWITNGMVSNVGTTLCWVTLHILSPYYVENYDAFRREHESIVSITKGK